MPDGYTFAHRKRWQPDLAKPLSRQEQELLASLLHWREGSRMIDGTKLGDGYRLALRDMVRPLAIDGSFTVQAEVTPFGRLVVHAHDAVGICCDFPLDPVPRPLFEINCPECDGTGAEKPDCWLCKGELTIKVQKAYRHGYKKDDLENLEDDGYCDCPACDGETCHTCEGGGKVRADYLWREAQRVLLTATKDCRTLFPDMEWIREVGIIDADKLLSPAAHGWLYDLGYSFGRFNNMFSDFILLSEEGERAAASLLVPTEVPDAIRMWLVGEPWKPAKASGHYYANPREQERFDEAAAFHRCYFRGWIDHDRYGDSRWTEEGRTAIAGWEGSELLPDRPRLEDPCGFIRAMESVSRERRGVAYWTAAAIRVADGVERAQAALEAADHAGDSKRAEWWRNQIAHLSRSHGYDLRQVENHRFFLRYALAQLQKQEALSQANEASNG